MRTVIAHSSPDSGRVRSRYAYRMAVRAARWGCAGCVNDCPPYGRTWVVQLETNVWPVALRKRFGGGMPLRGVLRPESGASGEAPPRCPGRPAMRACIRRRAGGRSDPVLSPPRHRPVAVSPRFLHMTPTSGRGPSDWPAPPRTREVPTAIRRSIRSNPGPPLRAVASGRGVGRRLGSRVRGFAGLLVRGSADARGAGRSGPGRVPGPGAAGRGAAIAARRFRRAGSGTRRGQPPCDHRRSRPGGPAQGLRRERFGP